MVRHAFGYGRVRRFSISASAVERSAYGPSRRTPEAFPTSSMSAVTTYQRLPRCSTPYWNSDVQLLGVIPTRSVSDTSSAHSNAIRAQAFARLRYEHALNVPLRVTAAERQESQQGGHDADGEQ